MNRTRKEKTGRGETGPSGTKHRHVKETKTDPNCRLPRTHDPPSKHHPHHAGQGQPPSSHLSTYKRRIDRYRAGIDIAPRMAMLPNTGEAAEEWAQFGDPGEAENDQNIQNPNPIGADFVEAEDDDPAPEVGICCGRGRNS